MNDYIKQLQEYKEKTWKAQRTTWMESDVKTLLETGKCEGHSAASCRSMLSKLRRDRSFRNKFCGLVHEFSDKLGQCGKWARLNKEETELIARHIVPYGRDQHACAVYATNNSLTDRTSRQPWAYESKAEYEARTGKTVPVQEIVEEPVEVKTPIVDELTLNIKATKALLEGGLNFTQIAKIMNKEENLVISLLKVAEAFKV